MRYRSRSTYNRFPKVPIQRRVAAFVIDFSLVWLVSLPLASNSSGISIAQLIAFLLAWLVLRAVLVVTNQGQSLGRWALDMKVVDLKSAKTPGLLELSKREGITGLASVLAVMGLSLGVSNGIGLLVLIIPLGIDFVSALTDAESQQALHDRIAQTTIVASNRGFSLDLRLKKFINQLSRRTK